MMRLEGVLINRKGIELALTRLSRQRKLCDFFILGSITFLCLVDLFHFSYWLLYGVVIFSVGLFVGKRDEVISWESAFSKLLKLAKENES